MAGTELTAGTISTGANATSYAGGSISPTADRILILSCLSESSAGVEVLRPTAASGGTLATTWTFLREEKFDTNSKLGEFVFYGLSTGTPGSGAVTVDFDTQTQTRFECRITEFSGRLLTGTNGVDAIVQSSSNSSTGGTAVSAALNAFADATNNEAVLCTNTAAGTVNFTVEAGGDWASISAVTTAVRSNVASRIGEDTTPTLTLSGSVPWGAIALELAAEGGGASDIVVLRRRRGA